jgi:hypothetical protein
VSGSRESKSEEPTSLSFPTHHRRPPRPKSQKHTHNRWWNHLNPAVKKGAFTDWEDAVIIKVRGAKFFLHAEAALDDDERPTEAQALIRSLTPPNPPNTPGARDQRQQVVGYVGIRPFFRLENTTNFHSSRPLTPPFASPAEQNQKQNSHRQAAARPHRQCRQEPVELDPQAQGRDQQHEGQVRSSTRSIDRRFFLSEKKNAPDV